MSKAQLVITALVLEGRSKSEVARDYDVSRNWVQQLVKRYEAEGTAAFEPHSRRPHHNPRAVDRRRRRHTSCGCARRSTSAGSTPAPTPSPTHLAANPAISKVPAVSTIWRILHRRGFVTPNRRNGHADLGNASKPSYPTSAGKPTLPTGTWPTGASVEILHIIDDHSRLAIASRARRTITGPDVVTASPPHSPDWAHQLRC